MRSLTGAHGTPVCHPGNYDGCLIRLLSNTATAVMMVPIAMSLIDVVSRKAGHLQPGSNDKTGDVSLNAPDNFALTLMLGIAYATSIGGVAIYSTVASGVLRILPLGPFPPFTLDGSYPASEVSRILSSFVPSSSIHTFMV